MYNLVLAIDKNNGSIVDLTESFNNSNKTLQEFCNTLRLRFSQVTVQFQALCLKSKLDAISITYTI